jgi:hypothetical protein
MITGKNGELLLVATYNLLCEGNGRYGLASKSSAYNNPA